MDWMLGIEEELGRKVFDNLAGPASGQQQVCPGGRG